jgi:hypothetical protein
MEQAQGQATNRLEGYVAHTIKTRPISEPTSSATI